MRGASGDSFASIGLSFIVFSSASENFLQVTMPFSIIFFDSNPEK